jgi:hypothetical protein
VLILINLETELRTSFQRTVLSDLLGQVQVSMGGIAIGWLSEFVFDATVIRFKHVFGLIDQGYVIDWLVQKTDCKYVRC